MAQMYKFEGTMSEGFLFGIDENLRGEHLKKQGLTFVYNDSYKKTGIYFDPAVDTQESRIFEKLCKSLLTEMTKEQFEHEISESYMAIGAHPKQPWDGDRYEG